MNEETADAIALIMLILGASLVVASVWMMKDATWAGLVAGALMIYGASAIIRGGHD